jgi:hypothetical protein
LAANASDKTTWPLMLALATQPPWLWGAWLDAQFFLGECNDLVHTLGLR